MEILRIYKNHLFIHDYSYESFVFLMLKLTILNNASRVFYRITKKPEADKDYFKIRERGNLINYCKNFFNFMDSF